MNTENKIKKLATSLVEKMFITFQDEKMQGPNFTWESFPEMMSDLAKGHAPMAFYTVSGEKLKDIEEKVGKLAFTLAKEKVDNEILKRPTMKI